MVSYLTLVLGYPGFQGVFVFEHGLRSRESQTLHLYINQLQDAMNEIDDRINCSPNVLLLLIVMASRNL